MKIILEILAFLLVLSPVFSFALEFKAQGQWVMSFGYGANGDFQGSYNHHRQTGWGNGKDNFEPSQRVQLYLHAVASENLSGTVSIEMGETWFGQSSTGGALGADGKIIEVMSAYLDWQMPNLPLKTRMGLQSIVTPAMASGNSVLNGTLAAIVLNAKINANFGLTCFWGRPYNDNYPGWDNNGVRNYNAGFMDNTDAFGLLLPISGENFKITPWGMHAAIGPNALRGAVNSSGSPFGNIANVGASGNLFAGSMYPVGGARHRNFTNANTARKLTAYGHAWWVGISGEISVFEPLRLAFDFDYGGVTQEDSRLNRAGWFFSLCGQYHRNWGVPALYFWHGSGDDANPANGSERLPALDPDNSSSYSFFAFDGSPYLERNALIANNLAGTWGVGARIADLAFISDVKSLFCINFINGTNSPTMAKKMSLAGLWANGNVLTPEYVGNGAAVGMPGLYMTSADYALEFGTINKWRIAENWNINFEAAYICLHLDTGSSAWGARHGHGQSIPQTKDAWNMNLSFVYSF